MKSVHIYLTKPKKHPFPVMSWLIRIFEKTKYSHCVTSWYVNSLERMVYFEANGSGVNFLNGKLFEKKYEVVKEYKFDASRSGLKKVAQFCHDNSGKKYAKKQLIGLLLIRLLRPFNVNISNPWKDGDYSQICIETGALVLRAAKILELPKEMESYGLKDFEQLLDKLSN